MVITIDRAEVPTRVETRLFTDGLEANGIPRGSGNLRECVADERCVVEVLGEQLVVRLTQLPEGQVYLVIYAEWYVPFADRPPASVDNPVVSASWGFCLET